MPRPEVSRQIVARLDDLHARYSPTPQDRVVRYYTPGRGYHGPEPGQDHQEFGISLASLDGEVYCSGLCDVRFPMQSISKVFTYLLALEDHGREHVLTRVGVDPSGDSYRSIVFDERARRPYNPMVNAGALATADLVKGADLDEKLDRIVGFMRRMAGNERLEVDRAIFGHEMQTNDRN